TSNSYDSKSINTKLYREAMPSSAKTLNMQESESVQAKEEKKRDMDGDPLDSIEMEASHRQRPIGLSKNQLSKNQDEFELINIIIFCNVMLYFFFFYHQI
ncbi:hypothetical protein U1Q18_027679, partial [Sarracenia purpurea var. burkii]